MTRGGEGVRGFALWLVGASIAFFVTAGAFLLLANLGAGLGQSGPIPQSPSSAGSGPALTLRFAESRLEELETSTGQTVPLYVENVSEDELQEVDVTLDVATEGTVDTRERSYRTSVTDLAPGERRSVELEVDLSPPPPAGDREGTDGLDTAGEREILEARATAPGGRSAIQTLVLP